MLFPLHTDARPGYESLKKVSTSLLRTCRRVYLETHDLPPRTKGHVFWHESRPDNLRVPDEASCFRRLTPTQMKYVEEVHMFIQQYWLERVLRHTCDRTLSSLPNLKKLTLALRFCDWWFCERNADLGLNAPLGTTHADSMRRELAAARNGRDARSVLWVGSAWGCAFKHLHELVELEMELENFIWKADNQLAEVVEAAKTWEAPSHDARFVLSAMRLDVKSWQWGGPMRAWPGTSPTPMEDGASKLQEQGLSPTLVVMSVRWKKTLLTDLHPKPLY